MKTRDWWACLFRGIVGLVFVPLAFAAFERAPGINDVPLGSLTLARIDSQALWVGAGCLGLFIAWVYLRNAWTIWRQGGTWPPEEN